MNIDKRVLIVGGSGFLGNELGILLSRAGYEINLLGRSTPDNLAFPAQCYHWEGNYQVPKQAVTDVRAVINLAGASIATGRWTQQRMRQIRASRVETTIGVIRAVQEASVPVLIQGSATGFYGDHGDLPIDESTPPTGGAFLTEVCRQWEEPLKYLPSVTRTVILRTGVVLGLSGGALGSILKPYLLGLGARIGEGDHFLPWIHVNDFCNLVLTALEDERYSGPVNMCAPHPVTYADLHKQACEIFGGSSRLSVPKSFLRILLGKKAEIVTQGARVIPGVASSLGYQFLFPTFQSALTDLLGEGPLRDCSYLCLKQWVPESRKNVWDFFKSEKNLETITPPWLNFKVESISTPEVTEGSRISYRLKLHGIPLRWHTLIQDWDPQIQFVDTQEKGPYKVWHHTHSFSDLGEGTLVEDLVRYKAPFGFLGRLIGNTYVSWDVAKIFRFRLGMIKRRFSAHL